MAPAAIQVSESNFKMLNRKAGHRKDCHGKIRYQTTKLAQKDAIDFWEIIELDLLQPNTIFSGREMALAHGGALAGFVRET